jgi:hypothetical protein
MFMCVVNLKLVNKLDLTWKQPFLILAYNKIFKFTEKFFNIVSWFSQGSLTEGEGTVRLTSFY